MKTTALNMGSTRFSRTNYDVRSQPTLTLVVENYHSRVLKVSYSRTDCGVRNQPTLSLIFGNYVSRLSFWKISLDTGLKLVWHLI